MAARAAGARQKGANTAAATLEDSVPETVKKERNQVLLEVQKRISLQTHQGAVGDTVEVLVDGPSKLDASRWTGRNRRHQIVVFPRGEGTILEGKLGPVAVKEVTPLTLVGESVGEFH